MPVPMVFLVGIPNFPRCLVQVLRSYRAYPEVSGTGIEVFAEFTPKGRVLLLRSRRIYPDVSAAGIDVVPNFPQCRYRY